MAKAREIKEETLIEKTGKSSQQWTELLDKWGAGSKGHTKTAKHLRENFKVSSWWAQVITNRYEWKRGLRDK